MTDLILVCGFFTILLQTACSAPEPLSQPLTSFILSAPNEQVTYDQARRMCDAHGNMRPVSITNKEKNLEVVQYLASYAKNQGETDTWNVLSPTDIESVWTSGNDLTLRNHYVWTGIDQSFAYTNWLVSAPLHDESCRCVSFAYGFGSACPGNAAKCSGWTVERCSTKRRVLCELVFPGGDPAVPQEPIPVQSQTACEGTALTLSCPNGRSLAIISANYGRTGGSNSCPHSSAQTTQCYAAGTLKILQNRCQGKSHCSVLASNSAFGDPCKGTYKYLQVTFQCV